MHFLLLCVFMSSPLRSMRTSTSKVVTCLDIGVIVGASASSVICSLMGLAKTKEMNRRLYEVGVGVQHLELIFIPVLAPLLPVGIFKCYVCT